jgi:hypothetical protein
MIALASYFTIFNILVIRNGLLLVLTFLLGAFLGGAIAFIGKKQNASKFLVISITILLGIFTPACLFQMLFLVLGPGLY